MLIQTTCKAFRKFTLILKEHFRINFWECYWLKLAAEQQCHSTRIKSTGPYMTSGHVECLIKSKLYKHSHNVYWVSFASVHHKPRHSQSSSPPHEIPFCPEIFSSTLVHQSLMSQLESVWKHNQNILRHRKFSI